jgi:superfamily I DNA/RNA helicase
VPSIPAEYFKNVTVSKQAIVRQVNDFLSSDVLDIEEVTELNETNTKVCKDILNAMASDKLPISHAFYLKLLHIKVMNNTLKLSPVDVLILEEAHDMSRVMVDIVEQYPAKQKIYIGDSYQMVLGFTGSVNVFDLLKGRGTKLHLSKSFRVNTKDAKIVQNFMRDKVDSKFVFEGFDKPIPDRITKAYLTRTNATLIAKMRSLNTLGIPYKLSTKTKLSQLFSLPLTLATLNKPILNEEYKYLQHYINKFNTNSRIRAQNKTPLIYIMREFEDNKAIQQAAKLVMSLGVSALFDTYKQAKVHQKSACNYILSTATSSKGQTWTTVELDKDITKALLTTEQAYQDGRITEKALLEEYYLFYVAITRHTHMLVSNSDYLTQYTE